MCPSCYDYWRLHDILPRHARDRPSHAPADDPIAVLEALLEQEQRKTLNARQKAQDMKERRDRLLNEHAALRAQLTDQAALMRRADELAATASALPDVVKTHALRQALSNYRKVREAAPD